MTEIQKRGIGKGALIVLSVLVAILTFSNIMTYTNLQNQIITLTTEKNNLQSQVNSLQNQMTSLSDEKTNLQSQLNSLNTTYQNYMASHSHSNTEYNTLQTRYDNYVAVHHYTNSEYNALKSYYRGLSNKVTELNKLLYSYCQVPDAFSRTLNDAEVRKISSAVSSATGSSTDFWFSVQRIYDYIISNVMYTEDIDMPYPSTCSHKNIDGFNYITTFTMTTYRNYVQTPSLTLEIEQGDCDDQAVLAYVMIEYYMKYIYLTEYILYITHIEFSEGLAHLAVIIPVQEGQLCIVDPAGEYLTSRWGYIASMQALSELQAYSDYWSYWYGSVTYMELYSVSTKDGSYTLVAKGTIDQIATAFT